jgi:hypothetical protein
VIPETRSNDAAAPRARHDARPDEDCGKLGVSFFRYLDDRLSIPGAITVPPLPDLVRQAAPP